MESRVGLIILRLNVRLLPNKKGLQVIVFDNGVLKIITIIKYYNCSGDQPRTQIKQDRY